MIIDSYDNKSKPFLRAEDIYQAAEKNEDVCLVTFKTKVLEETIKKYHGEFYTSYKTTNGKKDIYTFNHEGKRYFMYVTDVGATPTAILLNEVSVVVGCHKFVYFGSCGVLDEKKCRGKIIVPTNSYRDEGISYHYYPASDYIDVRNGEKVAEILKKNNIPYVKGRVWTTDGIYMETENKVKARKEDGAIAVEMEVSGVEAIARHLNVDNYHILFSADSLDGSDWDRADFGGDKELVQQLKAFEIALKIASNL